MSEPTDDQPFDPYRFGAPEHPVPPEFAPPGYEKTGYHPPAAQPPVPPAPPAPPPNPSAPPGFSAPPSTPYGQPYGQQPPYGQPPYVQPPYVQPYGQQPYGQPAPPGQFPVPPNYYGYQPPTQGNGKAVAGLVLGILSCVFFIFTIADALLIVPGLIFSLLGLAQARRTGVGAAKARWGLGLTIVATVLALVLLTVGIVLIKNTDCSVSHSSGSIDARICSSQNK